MKEGKKAKKGKKKDENGGTSQPAAIPPRRLVTIREACTYGHISRTKLYDKMNGGEVKAYKRDGWTMIDLNSVDDMNNALPEYMPVAYLFDI